MRRAPRNLAFQGLPTNKRQGRWERIHVTNRLTALEKGNVEVRHTGGTHLPLLHQSGHRFPGFLDRRSRLIRPMELVQIDSLDTKPPQRSLALGPDRLGGEHLTRWNFGGALIPDHATLRE